MLQDYLSTASIKHAKEPCVPLATGRKLPQESAKSVTLIITWQDWLPILVLPDYNILVQAFCHTYFMVKLIRRA